MRCAFLLAAMTSVALSGANPLFAQSMGVEAERVKRASAIDKDNGAVVISIRSEVYLDEPLDLYFLREGGEVGIPSDVVQLSRRQNPLAFGNSTVKFQVRAYQLRAGTYRLVAHGMDCPKIPAENERCLIDQRGLNGTVEVSRPSRGYGEIAPTFKILSGSVTYAGDFALTARNTVEWSQIPAKELERISRQFSSMQRGPEPQIPEGFNLKYGLFPRSYGDDRGRRY